MKLFNLDCHISVIADLKQIFENLGHEVNSWSISGHNWVFNRNQSKVDVINQETWRNIDKKMCNDFYERYKIELSEYDGFICTYPLSFSMLYEKFEKKIILQIPIRYEVPFQNDPYKWTEFNDFLRKKIDEGIIIPVANSMYDKKYFEFFVERDCKLIPNICEYIESSWEPSKDKFLYCSRLPLSFDKNKIIDKSSLGRYQWKDLYSYKGIIIIPYNCSTMSIFEHYTANIPIFCPSINFMVELFFKYPNYVLSELTWNRIYQMSPNSVIECDRSKDPNSYNNLNIMSEWIKFSDFYNQDWMPHIIYFDSFDDLSSKLEKTNLSEVSLKMKEFNLIRKERIYDEWKKIFNDIEI
jgi:hypothetical protein